MLNSVLAREKRGYIIDTRTQNLAQSAKVMCSMIYGSYITHLENGFTHKLVAGLLLKTVVSVLGLV